MTEVFVEQPLALSGSAKKYSKKEISKKRLKNTLLFNKVKYLLQKLLDNLEMWLKALISSIEGGFQSKKIIDWPAGQIVATSSKQGCTL